MDIDPRAVIAASNNADLYAAMFAVHGLDYARRPHAFSGKDRPPPYYSNLTVLLPAHVDEVIAELQELSQRFNGAIGLKDSFSELELEGNGFEVLFGASWIWREPGLETVSDWHRIDFEAGLQSWEDAWKHSGSPTPHRMFPAAMLERADMIFLGHMVDGVMLAGCIATISQNCVGISNVFSRAPSSEVFMQATAAVSAVTPDLPIAGYESGNDLDDALAAGFSTVGDLRILVTRHARF